MKKKIAIVTATRAEYGLLLPIIKKIINQNILEVKLVVTGAHLSPEFGMTIHEIEKENLKIDKKIDILLASNTSVGVSKSMGLALIGFAEYFDESKPDAVMILGDRYEMLAVASAALNARIPIIHLHGGETTEGAVDEAIRHAITKMSYLHFTSTESYRNRVIQLGENPERVFNVGAMGIENALRVEKITKGELEQSIGYSLGDKYAVGTFHPVTLENETAEEQIDQLIEAMKEFPSIKFLFTKANADVNGRIINQRLLECAKQMDNIVLIDNLGTKLYLNAIRMASFVIGNSSSGIIEVPAFHVPTVNIGDRQKGRIQSKSVINCKEQKEDIIRAIKKAMSEEFLKSIEKVKSAYGDGNTSDQIVEIITKWICNTYIDLKKKFYDISI